MDRNRGSILNLLQWQNIPRLGSAGCNRRPTSVQRDFIRENIRRVRLPRAKPISATSTSRISDLANMGTGVIERYLSDINREHDHVTKMEFRSDEYELNQQRKRTTCDEGTQTEMHDNTNVDCCLAKSPSKHGGFLRAHEQTGQLNKKGALSGIPVKTLAPVLSPSRDDVSRACTAKDTQLIRRNLNYMRANANAVSSGCVLDRRSTNQQIKRSPSSQRRTSGRIPPYLLRRRKEEEEKEAAGKKAAERSATPTGYRRVSSEEREDTLRSLEEAHAKTLEELTRLPLHASTNRDRNLRTQLEDRLSDIEDVISVFRKPVVFITLN